jgi:hypothetical protein
LAVSALMVVSGSGAAPTASRPESSASDLRTQRLAFPGELEGAGRSRLTVENRDGSSRAAFGGRIYIYSLSWSGGRKLVYSTN